jgi:hypothetical protein
MKRIDQTLRHLERDTDELAEAYLLSTEALSTREERQLRHVRAKLAELIGPWAD